MYVQFKECHPLLKIDISKFCELRPKWCVTVGARGSHSVCVCTIHQNPKLMLAAVDGLKLDLVQVMELVVCSTTQKKCILMKCPTCPGKEGAVVSLLNHLHELDMDDDDYIIYKQWVHTDRTLLITCETTVSQFVDDLAHKADQLTTHHYIAKSQASYLTKAKESLSDTEAIVLLDFAENHSFLIQDAAQGFYWDNSQATLHPIVVYLKEDGKVTCKSICCLSDVMKHDTVAVYAFQKELITHLKKEHPQIEKLVYFSDGAASQYKNYKNLMNLCLHQADFGLRAEWHFFATSHGKSPCDGIGGTVKRLAARASLQATTTDHILTLEQLHMWCIKNIHGIKFFFVSKEKIAEASRQLAARFKVAKTIQGMRSNHCFLPVSETELKISRVSEDVLTFTESVAEPDVSSVPANTYLPGQYVACMYDRCWWLGNVIMVADDNADIQINFMHPKGPSHSFAWPTRKDECWIPLTHIFCAKCQHHPPHHLEDGITWIQQPWPMSRMHLKLSMLTIPHDSECLPLDCPSGQYMGGPNRTVCLALGSVEWSGC